jgi:Putative prokaryotic signal transducing protein
MEGKWKTLLLTHDMLEAEMVKDILESGGMPVTILSSKVTPYPVNIGRMGEVKVLVMEEDLEKAREVLESGEIDLISRNDNMMVEGDDCDC